MWATLYDLGRRCFRHGRLVLLIWVGVLVLAAAGAGLLQKGTDNTFTLPGSQSQEAMDQLTHLVPQLTGAQAQVIVLPPAGTKADAPAVQADVEAFITQVEAVDLVAAVSSPYDPSNVGAINPTDEAALVSVRLTVGDPQVTAGFRTDLLDLAEALQQELGPGSTVSVGGDAFSIDPVTVGVTELLGLLIAFLVLYLAFRSFIAASMPLVTAVMAVGITMMLILLATSFMTISSSALTLSVMLGVAVGIDYTLFVLSRYRELLGEGTEPEEAAATAVATAGSAVLFAALTVVVALFGLAVPGIPLLTIMGVCAATGVTMAAAMTITATPALFSVFGSRLRPKTRKPRGRRKQARPRTRFAQIWVRVVTRVPAVTVLVCTVPLIILAIPASQIELSLPNSGSAEEGTPQRTTYDLISQYYGPGYNGPLLVTADIISSDDPVGLTSDLGGYFAMQPGVASVPQATPDQTGVLAIVQIIPTTGPSDPATTQLVEELRADQPYVQQTYGVTTRVTGSTAVGIDVSDQLASALVPFLILVVGLSLVLLMVVFRSIVVPITATLGYVLSLGTALGVVTIVFVLGYGADALGVPAVGPVISFLPVVLMAVLFGLAMDYEVFLVSRIQEHFAHHADPRRAIEEGFVSASHVITAAALIMFAVFLSFFPEGDSTIKPISLGLAVGVFVDAFIVRMTLMPALLAMFGRLTWSLPAPLAARLPRIDIEGEGLAREVRLADWPQDGDDVAIAAREVTVAAPDGVELAPLSVEIRRGVLTVLVGEDPGRLRVAQLTLAGRIRLVSGDLRIGGRLIPGRSRQARRMVQVLDTDALLTVATDPDPVIQRGLLGESGGERILMVLDVDTLRDARWRAAAWAWLRERADEGWTVVVGSLSPIEVPGADVMRLDGVGSVVAVGDN